MSYSGKTNWQFDEVVKEADLNRIEQGIVDAHAELEDVTPESIGAAPKAEFDAHVNDAGLHVTAAKQATWDAKETTEGSQAKADKAEENAINASYPRTGGELNGDMTLPQGKKIKVKAPSGQSIDAVVHQGGDLNGVGLGVGAGGLTVLGGGESYKAILNDPTLVHANATHSTEDAIVAADGDVNLIAGLQTVGNRKILRYGNNGILTNDGKRVMDENLIRINGGKLEYYDGTGWKQAGGGSTVMIGASNAVKKTYNFNFTILDFSYSDPQREEKSQKLFSYKFPGVGSYRIKVTGDVLNGSTGNNASTSLVIMPTPNQTTGSNYTNITLGSSVNNTYRYFSSAFDPSVPVGAVVQVGRKNTTSASGGTLAPNQYGDGKWGNTYGISAEGGTGEKVRIFDVIVTSNDPYHFFVAPNETVSNNIYYQIKKVEICYDEID